MIETLNDKLLRFRTENRFVDASSLSVALILTDVARSRGLPLETSNFMTSGGGQVRGLSGARLKKLLAGHGIEQTLSREGGRTSRGTPGKMKVWISFLNRELSGSPEDLRVVEAFWVERVRDYFAAKPLLIRLDPSRSLRSIVRDLIAQARKRQREATGTNYVGAVMQHLVGAKLDCILPAASLAHHSFSTSDLQSDRDGDFRISDSAIHVTSSPSAPVVARCADNLAKGLHPLIVTVGKGVAAAELFAADAGIADRIDIFELEQFLALNIFEMGRFLTDGKNEAAQRLVSRYNAIVEEFETDPSLKIEAV